MRSTHWIVFALATAVACQAAADTPVAQLEGRWAFNWASDPAKAKCERVEGELLKDFQSDAYRCRPTEEKAPGTGAVAADCMTMRPLKDYLIFRSKDLCEAERLAQASHNH